jgi:LytS/YehU family sensor histidine kinase
MPAKPAQPGQPSGVGLTNTRQRLAHSYPDRHELRINATEDRHRVELELELKP